MRAHTKETQSNLTPRMALEILKEGNTRFVNNLKAQRDLLAQANETRGLLPSYLVVLTAALRQN
jgi:carbonic anhydrase